MKLRAKFLRGEKVKYISHLDLMKLFERASRRTGLPLSYSQGFNPHPCMVFGLPLSVGVTSEAEYGDFEFNSDIDQNDFINGINSVFPSDLKVLEAVGYNGKENIMASISAASYDVLICIQNNDKLEDVLPSIEKLLKMNEINVIKEGKNRKKRELDIKAMIYNFSINEITRNNDAKGVISSSILEYMNILEGAMPKPYYIDYNMFCASMLVSAGSAANLKPELVINAININSDIDIKLIKVHRTGLYINKEGLLTDPFGKAL